MIKVSMKRTFCILLLLLFLSTTASAALVHFVSGVRQYYTSWISSFAITDTVTGRIYNRSFSTSHNPSSAELDAFAVTAKARIQKEIDYDDNVMNLRQDQVRALEYLDNILRYMVVGIRANPGITQAQAQTAINTAYPDSIVDFSKLYNFYKNLLNITTWSEFKIWVIDHKFRGIDND